MKSDVYFVPVGTTDAAVRAGALQKLLGALAPFLDYKKDEFLPVKITIGDELCIYHLSPDLVKLVVAAVKKSGAKPFLFDTSVIYKGQRHNAVDHMILAQNKGFTQPKTGAPFLVADGLFGQDGKEHGIGGPNIDKVRIPSFIGMTDSLVVISHVTGHILSRYAGALKNVAMGIACRATKQVQHSSLKPSITKSRCTACGCCLEICPASAVAYRDGKAFINEALCIGCGECLCACKFDAIGPIWKDDPRIFGRRMAEVAGFILSKFKKKLFFNFAFDITKECDCISTKHEPMVSKDLGILASVDPLALDKATADIMIREGQGEFFDKASDPYRDMFEYAATRGIGNIEYALLRI